MPLRFAVFFLAACLLIGCQPTGQPEFSSRTIVALGTLFTVEIHGEDESRAETALDQLESYIQTIDREWYAFGDGELGRINAALSAGEPATMSEELASLTRRSLQLKELSQGLFDPTIGMLVELWGFADAERMRAEPPDDIAIQRWQTDVDTDPLLHFEGRTLSVDRPIKLTFGGIAKGTALNGACDLLRDLGVNSAMVDAGGDLKVIGRRGSRGWRIGIRDPHSVGMLGFVELAPDEAIVTSGNYERYFEHEGQRFHHLLDPVTGRPVTVTAGVTVIHTNAELADAAATALMVAGPQRFHAIADRMGIDNALLISDRGDIIMTPAFANRIREPVRSAGSDVGIM